jgi:hypothetical protein
VINITINAEYFHTSIVEELTQRVREPVSVSAQHDISFLSEVRYHITFPNFALNCASVAYV